MSRESMLARIREAARAGCAYRVHVADPSPDTGYVGVGGDLVEAMAREVQDVGGVPHRVGRPGEALPVVAELLESVAARSVLAWQHPLLERLGVSEFLSRRGIEYWDHARLAALPLDRQRAVALAADAGISSVDWAIAETGSLLVCARPGRERMVSLLPPLHIAIVERRQLVPDLLDAFHNLRRQFGPELPSNMTLITGPSKTGDIELQLTTGVHGPGKWHVILIASAADSE
jgi:L-lactate dehydrogenase complex protein LldG